ncbi:hypothetical protein BO99DRAFT_435877 [Aspergillus violaceofuscus CBS 115571]|uniref:Uncharacterized protein n=1 Tax=Aspergillus violaceofuscus (strain CBS 115571) TaxID=1450538 RepID=A0A2V5H2D2_ASPV1|nr:hypothetical protein BO99DRAFT_435877 [Aspergillus violaceofuscus CBS 115571]
MSYPDDTDSESEWKDCCSVIEEDTDDLPGWDELPEWLRVKPGRQISPGAKPRSEDLELVPPPEENFPMIAPTSPKLERRISFLLHKAGIRCALCGETAMSLFGVSIAAHHSAWAILQADLAQAAKVLRETDFPECPADRQQGEERRKCAVLRVPRAPKEDELSLSEYPAPAYHFHTDHLYPRHREDPNKSREVLLYLKELLIADHYLDPPTGPASYHHDPGRWYVEEGRRNRDRDARMYVTTDDSDLPEMMLGSLNYRGRQSPNQYPVYMLAPHHQVENLARLIIRDRFSAVRNWWLQHLLLCLTPLTGDGDEEEEEGLRSGPHLRLSQIESTPIRNWLEQIASEDDLYNEYDAKGRWNMIGFRRVCLAIEGRTKYLMRLAEENMSDLSDSDIWAGLWLWLVASMVGKGVRESLDDL